MPAHEAPNVELGSAPDVVSVGPSPSPSEISSTSSPEPHNIRATPLFRMLAMPPPDPVQPPGQDELERRLPGYRRIIIPRELTLIELLKQYSGVETDDEVLRIREAKLRVVAERVGLRRLHVLTPRLQSLTLDGSALTSLRDLGIGLNRLKFLSVNRCALTTLDGIWGLSALRELHATNNRIQDLQPLAVLQKLHTLDVADNPITESSRLWTLGVCSSLRKLTLKGCPISTNANYRNNVASSLPMLIYLDERTLHTDIEYDDMETVLGPISSSSDSEAEEELIQKTVQVFEETSKIPEVEPVAGTSTSRDYFEPLIDEPTVTPTTEERKEDNSTKRVRLRRRPATTEGCGPRAEKPVLKERPKTAQERSSSVQFTKLQIMNTLLDDEWRCSGSKLTSNAPVCGNLAQALRRPVTSLYKRSIDIQQIERELAEETMADASRALAAEIPRAPRLEDWNRFREDTGIDIDIDFNQRPRGADPTSAIERLEQIEKETIERLDRESRKQSKNDTEDPDKKEVTPDAFEYDIDMWTIEDLRITSDPIDFDEILNIGSVRLPEASNVP